PEKGGWRSGYRCVWRARRARATRGCRPSRHPQLCRWLLLSLDRLPNNRLVMTQLIEYSRGRTTVLDRERLERGGRPRRLVARPAPAADCPLLWRLGGEVDVEVAIRSRRRGGPGVGRAH